MNIEFGTIDKKIIYFIEVDIVTILLSNNKSIDLFNIVFVLEYKSNLIFFDQLRKTGFTYQNKSIRMSLMRKSKIVAHIR